MSRLTGHMRHNVVAYLALFVALGGSSYAAIRLPANSVGAKQIKKSAVRSSDVKNASLLAADFKSGQLPAGPRGPQGHHGAQGPTGPAGLFPDGNVPSGKTLRGTFATRGTAGAGGTGSAADSASFIFQLASAPTVHYMLSGGAVPTGCAGGTPTAPRADRGHLCVYEAKTANVAALRGVLDPLRDLPGEATRWGFVTFSNADADGPFYTEGTWAVTAP